MARLLLPESAAAEVVAREIGVSVDTLQRWRRGGMSIAIAPMIDTPRRQAARQPLNRRFQALARLIPRWTRLGLDICGFRPHPNHTSVRLFRQN